jgi:DNA helicase-2/ATP-dependent DNA helicase PcrA
VSNDTAVTLSDPVLNGPYDPPTRYFDGRIDLVTQIETGEVSIVDFKSTDHAQPQTVTWDQLHVYALGYQELTGTGADVVEIRNLDETGTSERDAVRNARLSEVRHRILLAGEAVRQNRLPRHHDWVHACNTCDLVGLCRTRLSSSGAHND